MSVYQLMAKLIPIKTSKKAWLEFRTVTWARKR